MPIHHGETIERIIRREGHSISKIAKLIGISRRSLYSWFLQSQLKVETMNKIGQVMNYDFSKEFPELFGAAAFTETSGQKPAHNLMEKDNMSEVWKEKYFDLLERYNSLPTIIKKKRSKKISHDVFYLTFVNKNNQEYKLVLTSKPTKLFIETCKRAGYIITEKLSNK
jgi:predicted transcriptional regulator